MAKGSKKKLDAPTNPLVAALQAIKASGRVSQADGLPLLNNQPQLIEVNTEDVVDGLALARLTPAGEAMLSNTAAPIAAPTAATVASAFAIIDGFVPPESKRGFGKGGPGKTSKYPFATLEVNKSFFVPVSADLENPVKTLGSTVSNANNKYRTATGAMKEVTRTKRGDGNKAVLDDQGNKIKETKQVPVFNQDRKFVIRGVEKGKVYGDWTATENGAMITRTL